MEAQFVCPECRAQHAEPAEAALGHIVVCIECAVAQSDFLWRDGVAIGIAVAA